MLLFMQAAIVQLSKFVPYFIIFYIRKTIRLRSIFINYLSSQASADIFLVAGGLANRIKNPEGTI